jgi:hypothetical protein
MRSMKILRKWVCFSQKRCDPRAQRSAIGVAAQRAQYNDNLTCSNATMSLIICFFLQEAPEPFAPTHAYGRIAPGIVRANPSPTVRSPRGQFARAHPLRWDLPGDSSREPIPYGEISPGTVRANPSPTVGSPRGQFARAHPLR